MEGFIRRATRFTLEDADRLGTQIGIDWSGSPFGADQFQSGLEVELEHGSHDPNTRVATSRPFLRQMDGQPRMRW